MEELKLEKIFEEVLESKDLPTAFYNISELLNEYTSILKNFMDLRLIDPSENSLRITESVESVSKELNRCLESIKFNIELVKKWIKKGYPKDKLDESNYNIILLSGAYSDAYNSYTWMKEPHKTKITPLQDKVRKQIEKLDILINKHNLRHNDKFLTMAEAKLIFDQGPLEYQRKTFKDK